MDLTLNRDVMNVELSGIRQFTYLVRDTPGACALTIGEPDLPTPAPICEAAVRALTGGSTHYTTNQGSASLRAKLAAYEAKTRQLDYGPDEILVTAGATEAIYCALTGVLDPGDEVVIPTPAFGLYETVTRLAGAVSVYLDTARTGFQLTYEALCAAITPRTKALVLNSPNNPTGAVYTEASLAAVCRAVGDRPIFILCDDVYRGLCTRPCPDPAALPGLRERLLIAQSFSKPWAMTGWRIGFAAASREITQVMNNYLSHSLSGTCSIAQAAAAEAFGGPQEEIEAMRQAFETRRNYLYDRMSQIPGVHPVRSEATFYMLMNLSQLIGKTLYGVEIHDADDFANVFLKEGLVAVVPCTGFGAPHYVRWSFAVSMENIKEGMDRLEKFLKNA